MSIKNTPPNWQKDAIPTPRGWVHPRTKELLVSTKLDQEFCVSFGKTEEVKVEEVKQEIKAPKAKKAAKSDE